jgi:uncharacterized protein
MKNEYITVKRSKIHGKGIYAKRDIPAGTHVIQYVGEKITRKESDRRLVANEKAGKSIYMFELNSRYDIDGDVSWNPAKYINHTCTPNCHTEIIDKEIWIIAQKNIKKGEELSYDYEFQRDGWQNSPCRCLTRKCFGFIVARKHWSGIKKTKRYQALREA